MLISDWSSDVCSSDLSTRQRQDHARRSSGATAIASSGRAAREAVRDQRKDGDQVAQPAVGRGHAGGAEGTAQHRAVDDGRSRDRGAQGARSEVHTSELQSLMRTSYAVFCLKKQKHTYTPKQHI